MFGIQINFRDGKKAWIDPVEDEPTEKDGVLIVENSNTGYKYDYKMIDIATVIKYDLCPTCGFDVRTYNCTEAECLNQRHWE